MSNAPPETDHSPTAANHFELPRFIRAQAGIYDQALGELKVGHKRSHWMWFIFPQILGLGLSENARLYAISGEAEAEAYLAHELLGTRLAECTDGMLSWVDRKTPLEILGPIDALKFHSSMTLFDAVSEENSRFASALDGFYSGVRDKATMEKLAGAD